MFGSGPFVSCNNLHAQSKSKQNRALIYWPKVEVVIKVKDWWQYN